MKMQITNFLKRVLLLDAASCLGMGLMLVAGAGALAPLFGLDRTLVAGAGGVLIPIGLFILLVGTRRSAPAAFVYLIVAGNALWVLESLLTIRGADGITTLGTLFVAAQAAAVAVLALLEWIGVRRAGPVAAQG
jgi:hypothetical protein